VSSNEIVKATAIATSTPTPSTWMLGSGDEKPATTTPVMMLITGSAMSRRHFRGRVVRSSSAPSARWQDASSRTGRAMSSRAKKRRKVP
jgi:hypothetical protein